MNSNPNSSQSMAYQNLRQQMCTWENQKTLLNNKRVIRTIDTHTAGEPFRIIVEGMPELVGNTILEKRNCFKEHYDAIRQALVFEPRGHFDMYGCALTQPIDKGADVGVLFFHNEGYSTMCGHGIIGLVTALVETGAYPATTPTVPITIETPAGLVKATAHLNPQGAVDHVSFLNVPSFLYKKDLILEISGYGSITLDIAFGGAFYAIMPLEQIQLAPLPKHKDILIDLAKQIKQQINASIKIEHPFEDDLGFLYGTIFVGAPESSEHHSRNICIFAESEIDRSPTGTGVSARVALHYAKGEIELGQTIWIESILGQRSVFRGKAVQEMLFGGYQAIVPEVQGTAFLTGRHEFIIDPQDPLKDGFLLL